MANKLATTERLLNKGDGQGSKSKHRLSRMAQFVAKEKKKREKRKRK